MIFKNFQFTTSIRKTAKRFSELNNDPSEQTCIVFLFNWTITLLLQVHIRSYLIKGEQSTFLFFVSKIRYVRN